MVLNEVPLAISAEDIQFKEIYVVLQAILRWGTTWKRHHVAFHVDNTAVAWSILLRLDK